MQPPVFSPLDSLREERKAINALLEVMKNEQAHLIAADINGLQTLTSEKSRLVSMMSDFASKRHKALAAAGFVPKEASMQAWLDSMNATEASAEWAELLNLTRSAKELNRLNGVLINTHMANNQKALDALHVPRHAGNFYGPTGQSTNKTTSRRLVIG